MGSTYEMCPSFSQLDIADVNLMNAVFGGNHTLRPGVFTDGENLFRRQLRHLVLLAILVVDVMRAIGLVLSPRSPAKMTFVDAPAVVTGVHRIPASRWWRAVSFVANQIGRTTHTPLPAQLTIAVPVKRESPPKALIPLVWQDDVEEVLGNSGHRGFIAEIVGDYNG